MEQVGYVEKINGNIATILVKRVSACGESCQSCKSACHVAGVRINVEVSNDIKSGDYVEISTENEVMLKHILMLYGTPLVTMITFIFVTLFLLKGNPNADLAAGLLGIGSLILSHFILKAYDKKETKNNSVKYTVAKKL